MLDTRAFELVAGDGFLKLAQSIFDVGKNFNVSSNVDVKQLIPSPITVNTNSVIHESILSFFFPLLDQ